MRIQRILAPLAPTAGVVPPALADDDSGGGRTAARSRWMSEAAATSKAAELGYEARRIKDEHGCYELHAIVKSGGESR